MTERWQTVWAAADGWVRWSLVALIVATVGQTLFVLIYATRPWWRARVGRAYMLKSSTLGVVLWLSLIGAFYLLPEQIDTFALWAIALAILYQLVALLLSPRNPNA